MRTAALLAAAALLTAACAASGGRARGADAAPSGTATEAPIGGRAPGAVQVTRVEAATNVFEIASTTDAPTIDAQAAAAGADRTFGALVAVYEAVGLPVTVAQSETRTLGAREVRLSRRLGRVPLSAYLDCGRDALAVPIADSYTVTLTVLTRVAPDGPDASTLLTQLVGSARSATTSGHPIRCRSTGRLERELNTRAALAAVR